MRSSRILRDCRENNVATSIKLNLSDPRVVEIAGLAGFSAVWLCNEHVPSDWSAFEHAVRAAKIHDMDVIVRVSKGAYSDYIKPFECDAAAIMVPHITSAREAREVVEMCRFHPLGKRALDGGNIDGAFCTIPMGEYIEQSNTEKLIILQIESPEGVEAVEEIAAVEGFDFLLFGPGDYAHRIGKAGEIHAPEVLEARRRVEEATRRHGKRGYSVGAQGTPRELLERGYSLINLGADVSTLNQTFRNLLSEFAKNSEESGAYYANIK